MIVRPDIGTGEGVSLRLRDLPFLLVLRRPKRGKKPGWTSSLPASDASSSGKCDMPSGGCSVGARLNEPVFCELGLVRTVFRRRRPSHSTISFSPIGAILSLYKDLASLTSRLVRDALMARRSAPPPRIVSARGSYSGSSCSAIVRTWSRSPLKTAVSGTSFDDFANCSNTTPVQIWRNPMTTIVI